MPRTRTRTHRQWHTTVGLVGPDDVRALQVSVKTYRLQLSDTISKMPVATFAAKFSPDKWLALQNRCIAFENEYTSDWNPIAYLYAGTSYERGRQLVIELDSLRDQLAAQNAPGVDVPDPLQVPHSELGLAGGVGFALAAIVAIMLLREFHR